MALFAAGCRTGTANKLARLPRPLVHEGAYPITVTDDRGRRVTIRTPPRRIVSMTPSSTEILYALGLGSRVVGVTNWCDYPPEARKKPKVGDANISVEKVLALQPDLVVAHATLNRGAVRQLDGLHKTVVALDPKSFAQVFRDISLIGRVCGKDAAAARLKRKMESSLRAIRRAGVRSPGARTLVVIQPNPLWAAGPKTFVDEMLRVCNATNVAYDGRSGFNIFPVERALARDPQVIIVGKKDEREFFMRSPVWRNTSAVRSGRVVVINSDLLVRPGPRLVHGLELLAKAVRPPRRRVTSIFTLQMGNEGS